MLAAFDDLRGSSLDFFAQRKYNRRLMLGVLHCHRLSENLSREISIEINDSMIELKMANIFVAFILHSLQAPWGPLCRIDYVTGLGLFMHPCNHTSTHQALPIHLPHLLLPLYSPQ